MLEAPRGLSATLIDDSPPAPLVDRLQCVQRPRLRDDRHVRHHRVRTEQDQEIALLEVGKGPVHRASEHKLLRQILRADVDIERIENLRGSKRPPERACIAVMERRKGRGIAGIDANSAATVDRKSVVKGKSVSDRVDLGGRGTIKKKTKKT